jgi:hypothetical protein
MPIHGIPEKKFKIFTNALLHLTWHISLLTLKTSTDFENLGSFASITHWLWI